jgi:hypothetical protein
MDTDTAQEKINKLFGSYRAEWLDDQVFDLFSEPTYFPELMTMRPCVLLGGRGTGKTTVLRCLSYEGQYAFKKNGNGNFSNQQFFGIFYRVNTNRVTAFRGSERTEAQWTKLFGHYINLILGGLFIRFLNWHHGLYPELATFDEETLRLISVAFNLRKQVDISGLQNELRESLITFEAQINNIAEKEPGGITIQGAPLDVLIEASLDLPQFKGRQFYFLIDEYENLEDYQQRAVNTIIKHSGSLFSIKIGVKQLGWRKRDTLNSKEQLISPADYIRISLTDRLEGDAFDQFALKVCQARVDRVDAAQSHINVKELFPGLSDEEEAELLLKGNEPCAPTTKELVEALPLDLMLAFKNLTSLEKIFLATWPETHDGVDQFRNSVRLYIECDPRWRARYDNYKHALLFSLRRRKSGIRKYYAGWDVYAKLAAGNIRFFLELVDRSLIFHLQDGGRWGTPVSYKMQTETAQYVGRKNLEELEGVDVEGAKLTKLLLGLGRIFQVMAADPMEHTPEVTQFQIGSGISSEGENDRAARLLASAVNHLALLRLVGSKPSDPGDTKDSDYAVHPIYSAFFCFSYRRKRKMTLTYDQILLLVDNPKAAINDVLAKNGRSVEEAPLPEQMSLFKNYYGDFD